MRTIAYEVIDRVFLVAYGEADPTDAEWVSYLETIEAHGIERTMQIVHTDGGGPSAAQRRYLNELLKGRAVPVAVLSGSVAVRGMVTALSWFNWKIRAFRPGAVREAMAYLEIPSSRAPLLERRLALLQAEVRPARAA